MAELQSKFQVNQNVDRQTDEGTDRRTSSIHKQELLCNTAKKETLHDLVYR